MTDAALTQQFIAKWDAVTINEKATAQEHFIDLCRLLNVKTPNEADPHGQFFRFEKPLTKSGGKAGFADVWYKDRFAWEYKSKGKYTTLDAAYNQLRLYQEDLDNPPVLVACDIAKYEIHIAYTGYRTRVEKFTNADLANHSTRDLLRQVLTNPEQLRPTERAETITETVAGRFAQVAQMLERRGVAPTEIAPFFMKLLFALFAEDIKLLPAELMSQSLKQSVRNPAEFPQRALALFRAMRDGGYFGIDKVPRFNGWLFDSDVVIALTADELQFLGDASRQDWAAVEPAIFGTLFERSLDPAKRSQLGAHYTSRDDILLIIEPVLMAPLRREWAAIKTGIEALQAQWEAQSGNARRKLQSVAEGMLLDFAERLSTIKVLDPACGSGNFLYVALNALKDLEKEAWTYAAGLGLAQPELAVSPAQLFGIEKNPFAAELAQVVVWIGYLQWLKTNGFLEGQPHEPILQALHNIQAKDAILTVDLHGNPAEPDWPAADVIVGNPPFLGTKKMRGELGIEYVRAIHNLYGQRIPGFSDLVCYWFERARAYIEEGKVKRAGLLATNSVRLGENRRVLERIKATGDIFFAYADEPWTLDGAAVRISLIGFDNGSEPAKFLEGRPVVAIKPDLTSADFDITTVRTLPESQDIAFLGDVKGGSFDIPSHVAQEMLADTSNVDGRQNSEVVKRTANANDITKHWRDFWIIDFGVNMSLDEARLYQKPFAYVESVVKPERETGKPSRSEWWLHMRPGPSMRKSIEKLSRYIATPAVSKHRLFEWFVSDILSTHAIVVIARDDDYFFGVLHSKPHELWSLRMGTFLGVGNDPRYTPTTTFETFPFPYPPGSEDQGDAAVIAIAEAARALVAQRDAWLAGGGDGRRTMDDGDERRKTEDESSTLRRFNAGNNGQRATDKTRTLTNLYNKRPDWLAAAHRELDAAVLAAYGWPADLSDEVILERLLALNLARSQESEVSDQGPQEAAE